MNDITLVPLRRSEPVQSKRSGLRRHFSPRHWVTWLTFGLVLLLWQVIVWLKVYPEFIIPAPLGVAEKFWTVLLDGRLLTHTQSTFSAVLIGLLSGTVAGGMVGYLIARNKLMDQILTPLVVTMQSTPVVAYAPMLVIWFSGGPTSKIITSALIVFFPTLMNTVVGIRNVPQPLRDLMASLRASRWQTLRHLEAPAALPVLLGGLKIGATLAVIGAVVGEFVGGNSGLGYMITLARNQYDTELVVVAVLTLAMMARLLYSAVSYLESRLLAWQAYSRRD
jgi:NitT/TauT family transport system permease protein